MRLPSLLASLCTCPIGSPYFVRRHLDLRHEDLLFSAQKAKQIGSKLASILKSGVLRVPLLSDEISICQVRPSLSFAGKIPEERSKDRRKYLSLLLQLLRIFCQQPHIVRRQCVWLAGTLYDQVPDSILRP